MQFDSKVTIAAGYVKLLKTLLEICFRISKLVYELFINAWSMKACNDALAAFTLFQTIWPFFVQIIPMLVRDCLTAADVGASLVNLEHSPYADKH